MSPQTTGDSRRTRAGAQGYENRRINVTVLYGNRGG
jgi:hypothetical protein